MVMCNPRRISHGRDLVSVRIKPFLVRLMKAYERPFTVKLGSQIVEGMKVTTLFSG